MTREPKRAYRSPARDARAAETRQRVVSAATDVFVARGYASATIRQVASRAGVAVPTVELLFARKRELLKAAIDAARAGDDEPVPILERPEVLAAASSARSGEELLAAAAALIGSAQERSGVLVLAAFEGAAGDPELAGLAQQLAEERAVTAARLVDRLAALSPLAGPRAEAIDTLWLLMDPALFDRALRYRGWTTDRYQKWFAATAAQLCSGQPPTTRKSTRRARR